MERQRAVMRISYILNPVVIEKVEQKTHNIDQIDYEGLLELFSRDEDPPISPLNTNYLDQVYSPSVIDSLDVD
jgi:uncharacterized protein Yka (UPF0111/DUF47 family)